ncbi:phosphate/phosphite/phosphonate ABC transporter substrate-binding protein [Fusobacterium russii]|uniref:phosphate/phosphite/phosphonate ABC transporter substrate-binding protein n=1 Tax=Fusobacterium russii TaxID=854 RepID=UPI00039AF18C|nr:phosphate/phosphite/phosphonate ABC transporter substrate-binding protein [Fusobacterium russii]
MRKKLFLLAMVLVSALILLIGCAKKKEDKPLIMGFVPLSNSEKLVEEIKPLENMLAEKIGEKVEGFIATNYIGVVEALGTGTIDFALIPPFAYILANKKHGSEALLTSLNKNNEPGYYSVIVTRNDSGIDKVSDLKGKKIAFVDPSSTSGYIFPAVILMDNGIDIEKEIKYQFAGGHDKALQLLVNGDVDAVGTYENSLKKFSKEFPEIEKNTKILEKSDLIPGITLTVSSNLSEEKKTKIKEAFLAVTEEKEGQEILLKLFGLKGFQEANKNNYDSIKVKLEKLGIDIEKIK